MTDEGFPAAPAGALSTGAGNRRALLLQAVVADPRNHDAQQVYADALAAANDPRGEFIQLDTALDHPLSIRRREAMQRQRDALFAAHAKTWWPVRDVRLRVQQGFVTGIAGNLGKLDAAAALFDSEPIWQVEVLGLRGAEGVERLLKAAWLPRARRLAIRGKLGDDGFALLVASPAVAGVESLNVTGNRLGPEATAALGHHLPACRTLVLSRNKLDNEGMTGLTRWKHLGRLETLYLGKCKLTAAGVDRLLDGPPLARLEKLALTDNQLGNDVGLAIATKAHQLPALRHLDLVKTGLATSGAKTITEALLPAVKKIDLRSNRIDTKIIVDPRVTA